MPPHFFRHGSQEVASGTERLVLDLVRRSPGMSRADLTRACGLSGPGAKALIDTLVGRGMLQLGPPTSKGRGQPSATVGLVGDFAFSFGLAIAIDGFKLALIDFAGQLIDDYAESAFPLSLERVLANAGEQIEVMLHKHQIARLAVFGVGLSMTGPFTGHGSRVNPPLSMPSEWATEELDKFFSGRLALPVWMDNDANCATIAEAQFGIGRKSNNFVYLHFTDGLGSGVVQEGRLVRGAYGNSGELGRLFAIAGLPRVSLETLRHALRSTGLDLPNLRSMLDSYDPSWPEIDSWLESVAPSLTIAVAAIIALADPEFIIFGARLPRDLADRLIARVEFEKLPRRSTPAPNPVLLPSETNVNSVVIGAASIAFKRHFFL
ncbi:XylR family transcriptional regulator [Acidovorax sp. Root402]|nr:XylR family transcriptional regulator [Acidovorax sp. Root402]